MTVPIVNISLTGDRIQTQEGNWEMQMLVCGHTRFSAERFTSSVEKRGLHFSPLKNLLEKMHV